MTGSGIDWLRQKIGESGRINMLGAWTESRETGGEDCDYCSSLAFSLLGSSKLCLIKTEYRPLRMGGGKCCLVVFSHIEMTKLDISCYLR